MENLSHHEQQLANAFKNMSAAIDVPEPSAMRARAAITKLAKQPPRQDVISFVASFLNMRVKLYHVAIVFACIWFCYLYFEQKPQPIKHEAVRSNLPSALASTNNSTVLPCIQTFCLKK